MIDHTNEDMMPSTITVPVIIGIGLSAVFAISFVGYLNTGTDADIDSKILEFYRDFMLQSNTYVESVYLVNDPPTIVFIVSKTPDGYIVMDDPLPMFQELYPDENITGFVVVAGGSEMPYDMEDDMLQFNTHNKEILRIMGIEGSIE